MIYNARAVSIVPPSQPVGVLAGSVSQVDAVSAWKDVQSTQLDSPECEILHCSFDQDLGAIAILNLLDRVGERGLQTGL